MSININVDVKWTRNRDKSVRQIRKAEVYLSMQSQQFARIPGNPSG
jgi:hypothetical protein